MDTITYVEPTIPLEMNKPRVEPFTVYILCVHHGNYNVGNIDQINALTIILNNLSIPLVHTQTVPPTPPNIQVNKSIIWNALTYPITTYLKIMKHHLYQTMTGTNHLNFFLNIAIIQMVLFSHNNKLTVEQEKKKIW